MDNTQDKINAEISADLSEKLIAKPWAEATIKNLRCYLNRLDNQDRLEMIGDILEGYCVHCGSRDNASPCQCENDE